MKNNNFESFFGQYLNSSESFSGDNTNKNWYTDDSLFPNQDEDNMKFSDQNQNEYALYDNLPISYNDNIVKYELNIKTHSLKINYESNSQNPNNNSNNQAPQIQTNQKQQQIYQQQQQNSVKNEPQVPRYKTRLRKEKNANDSPKKSPKPRISLNITRNIINGLINYIQQKKNIVLRWLESNNLKLQDPDKFFNHQLKKRKNKLYSLKHFKRLICLKSVQGKILRVFGYKFFREEVFQFFFAKNFKHRSIQIQFRHTIENSFRDPENLVRLKD